ncbi:MAG: tetratricopeptide repeat protein, partial [bacterium]|nr:tetratricopeptide repeat protein [bacterium]
KEAFQISLKTDSKNNKSKKMLSFIEQKVIVKSLDRAYEFFDIKDYSSALKYLNKAVETFPNDPKVYYYRGLTREAVGDFKGAVSDFKDTVKIDRNYVVAYYKMAESLEKINKKKEALYMYEKYLGAENIDKEFAKKAEQKVIDLGERYY